MSNKNRIMAYENFQFILHVKDFSKILVSSKTSVSASFHVSKWSPYFSYSLDSKRIDNQLFVIGDCGFFFVLRLCSKNNNSDIFFSSLTISEIHQISLHFFWWFSTEHFLNLRKLSSIWPLSEQAAKLSNRLRTR